MVKKTMDRKGCFLRKDDGVRRKTIATMTELLFQCHMSMTDDLNGSGYNNLLYHLL